MKSAWWWNTEEWARYQAEYQQTRTQPEEYKSSPLDLGGHDFTYPFGTIWKRFEHQTQVVDLATHKWSDVRKSYHSIIHRAEAKYTITMMPACDIGQYKRLHVIANGGQVRNDRTYAIQGEWVRDGYGLMVGASDRETDNLVAVAYWIVYQGCAYYCSGPSTEQNVQQAVIWHSLKLVRAHGVRLVELGQTDGETEKERNIGKFKAGFGGTSQPFAIVRKLA